MPNYEDILKNNTGMLKCVKCESKENLVPFDYAKKYKTGSSRKGRVITETYDYKSSVVMACSNCVEEFNDWKKKYQEKEFWPRCIIVIGLGLTVIAFLAFSLPLIIIGVAIAVLMILYMYRGDFKETNPHKYISFSGTRVYVKPKNSKVWTRYDDWIKKSAIEQISSPIICPKCGSKLETDQKFCMNCGEQL